MDKEFVDKLRKDTNFKIALVMFIVGYIGFDLWTHASKEILTIDMATYWSAYGTVMQALFAGFQAIFAGIIIVITKALAKTQEGLSREQNRLAEDQKKMMQLQINQNLFDKRYKIYEALTKFMYDILSIKIPEKGRAARTFQEEYEKSVERFWFNSKEKFFLLDDDLNAFIDLIDAKANEYYSLVSANPVPSDAKEYAGWYSEIRKNQTNIMSLLRETPQRFKSCLKYDSDFKI